MDERGISTTWRVHSGWAVPGSGAQSAAPADPSIPAVFLASGHARHLLESNPAEAESRARAFLREHPADCDAACVLGAALRRQGRYEEARAILEPLSEAQPQMGDAWRELGLAVRELGDSARAERALLCALDRKWLDAETWSALAETKACDDPGERAAFCAAAEHLAKREYASALPHIDVLLERDPADILYRSMRAFALAWSRQFEAGIAELATLTRENPCGPGMWVEYARLLRATRDDRTADAFDTAVSLLPSFSEACAGLANTKSLPIREATLAAIREQLAKPALPADDRARFQYALGRALEDRGQYSDAFAAYRVFNEILKQTRGAGAAHGELYLRHARAFFTKEFFITRGSAGTEETGPVFIVGMPRSGSTLVEQILASHSAVEALGEINDLSNAGQKFARDRPGDPQGGYPYVLQYLDGAGFRRVGEAYLLSTRARRRSDKPFFTDKMPGNYCHVGLIHLALPNAHIVDVRRHPLDCGLSCYKHFFPVGHSHTLDLADIGRFYTSYVELMAHFDAVLPGRVHRVIYEDLVADPEAEIRRLLDRLELPFEAACLNFHENKRPVFTFSADQVRRPLFDTAIGHWKHFDEWLEPLRKALGPVLDCYPAAPAFAPASRAEAPASTAAPLRPSFFAGLRQTPFGTASQLAPRSATDRKPVR
jgi:tetratricopeptide (TPR) repeat protein